ncbi:hypothetical protein ACTOV4_24260, partial [Brucella sp. C7-11G]
LGGTLQGQQSTRMAAPKAGHTTALEMRCMTEPNSLNAGAFHTQRQGRTKRDFGQAVRLIPNRLISR